VAKLARLHPFCFDPRVRIPQYVMHIATCVTWFIFLAFWHYDSLQKKRYAIEYVAMFLSKRLSGRICEPTTFLFVERILSTRLYRQSNLDQMQYSWIIKTFSLVQFTTVHANLIEQTTSSIDSSFRNVA